MRLCKDVKRYVKYAINESKQFNISQAIKSRIITDGLKYSLATGNWGDRQYATKAGVSQVSSAGRTDVDRVGRLSIYVRRHGCSAN
eukprot:40347-Eustigmatos_ZCMA.PRE.1